ncbi:MAG: hypothetical protein R3C53_15530 [Pirellulaceae bacterium]
MLPLAQAPWMTAWLTPIWFLAMGVAMGLVGLGILVIIFRGLSAIPGWDDLTQGPAGHVIALVITAVLTGAIWYLLPDSFKSNPDKPDLNEPLLLAISLSLICAVVGWSLVFCSRSQPARNAFATLTDGAAGYLGIAALVVIFVGASVWGIGLAMGTPIVDSPIKALTSIPQLFSTGDQTFKTTVPGTPAGEVGEFVQVPTEIDFDLLTSLSIVSDTTVYLADAEKTSSFRRSPIRLGAAEVLEWKSTQNLSELPIPTQPDSSLYVQNQEVSPTVISIVAVTRPPVPESASLLITAIVVMLIGLAILLQQAVAPRLSAVAYATTTNEVAQPLFLVLMALGTLAILVYLMLPFFTFGEDVKILKENGITTIMLLAAFQGIWSASSSISEEIEGKTALTVLSKPIQRRSFVIGKFMGIFWMLLLMFVILGLIELAAVAYKPIYDAREASKGDVFWQACHAEMMATIPGLALAFMQAVTLTAVSVALATRLPQLANLSVCMAIYLIGNLSTAMISSTQYAFDIVKFIAQLIATVIPILEHFQLQAAIDGDKPITMSLLSGSLVYCLLYVLLAMFLALLLFEDRDLA